jgi:hypothetical protein
MGLVMKGFDRQSFFGCNSDDVLDRHHPPPGLDCAELLTLLLEEEHWEDIKSPHIRPSVDDSIDESTQLFKERCEGQFLGFARSHDWFNSSKGQQRLLNWVSSR